MKSKNLLAAVAAIAVLTTSTGVYAFANNQAESKQDAGESTTIVTETEDEAEDDAVVEDEVVEDEVTEDEVIEDEVVEDEVVEDEVIEDSETEDAEKPEADKEAPKKHIGIKEMVKNTFDPETQDFVDDAAKAEWFAYCADHVFAEPVKPEPPVKPEDDGTQPEPPVADETEKPEPPVKPVTVKELAKSVFDLEAQDFVDDDAKAEWFAYCAEHVFAEPVKPEAPVKPEDDGTKPEPPVKPEDDGTKPEPPVKPEDDGTKPEPPVKPEAPIAPVKPEPPADAPIPPHLRDEVKEEVSEDDTADEEIVEDEVTEEA